MANATAITVNTLTANSSTADPTADIMDTGTAAVTLKTAALNKTDRVFFRVQNTAVANLTVAVKAGAGGTYDGFRSGLGDFTTGNIAQNAYLILGPFESARFEQSDGTLSLTFTPASGTITCNVTCYKLPIV